MNIRTTESAKGEMLQFRTKTGRCFVTDVEIKIERFGLRGRLASLIFGDNSRRHLSPFTVTGVCLLLCGSVLLFSNQQEAATFPLILGAMCLLNSKLSRNLSVASVIKRDSVIRIEPHAPKTGLTRGYFTVHYRDDGKEKKRLIILPGNMEGGATEYQLALAKFRATGMLNQNDGV